MQLSRHLQMTDCHHFVNQCTSTESQYMTEASSLCRMIERGSHRCDERRRARILTYAPAFGRHGSKAYLDRLVKQAVEGNAWHAGGFLIVVDTTCFVEHSSSGVDSSTQAHALCVLECQRACHPAVHKLCMYLLALPALWNIAHQMLSSTQSVCLSVKEHAAEQCMGSACACCTAICTEF